MLDGSASVAAVCTVRMEDVVDEWSGDSEPTGSILATLGWLLLVALSSCCEDSVRVALLARSARTTLQQRICCRCGCSDGCTLYHRSLSLRVCLFCCDGVKETLHAAAVSVLSDKVMHQKQSSEKLQIHSCHGANNCKLRSAMSEIYGNYHKFGGQQLSGLSVTVRYGSSKSYRTILFLLSVSLALESQIDARRVFVQKRS
jgi:hypothetical protein